MVAGSGAVSIVSDLGSARTWQHGDKMKIKMLIVFGLILLGAQAQAQAPALVWACKIKGEVKGLDIAIGIRATILEGRGKVICKNAISGEVVESPAYLTMGRVSIGPQIAIPTGGETCIRVYEGNIGVSDPRAMFSEFTLTKALNLQLLCAQAELGLGVGVSVVNNFGFSGKLRFKSYCGSSIGIGAGLGISGMSVLTPAQYRKRQSSNAFNQSGG